MGCQQDVILGENLTFSICTHDPDTGELTDADSAPAYRVYEDETATPILTGNMAKLDDAGTTGFYTEQIACTEGNGFEANKSYNIYITATVGFDTGGISFAFTVKAAVNDPTAAAIRAEIDANSTQLAAILADTVSLNETAISEIAGVSDIPAEPTIRQAIMLLYMWLRNDTQALAAERRVLNDAGTEILDAVMSDDGTTFSQGKLGDA